MKRLIALFVVLLVASGSAMAHGRGGSRLVLGFNFGFPAYHAWYPAYYPAPVYYYPQPVVVAPPSPPVYSERSDSVPEGSSTWYYCPESRAYYPYTRECPGGWQRVPAQPTR